jgi:hypothetical protein
MLATMRGNAFNIYYIVDSSKHTHTHTHTHIYIYVNANNKKGN